MFIIKFSTDTLKIVLIVLLYGCIQTINLSCADINFVSTFVNLKNEPDTSKCSIDNKKGHIKSSSGQPHQELSSFAPSGTVKHAISSTRDKFDERLILYPKVEPMHSKKKLSDNRLYSIINDITKRREDQILRDEISDEMTKNDGDFNLFASEGDVNISSIANENNDLMHSTMATFVAESSFQSSHNFKAESSRTDPSAMMSTSTTVNLEVNPESDLRKIPTNTFLDAQHQNKGELIGNASTVSQLNETEDVAFLNSAQNEIVAEMGNVPSVDSSHEDIPSFREWTEKHLAEKEKERGDDNNVTIAVTKKLRKVRNKNYASLDCGAKLLATNPEAKSAGLFLSNSRDEYLLSICNTKIWFAVELCEALQIKKIELANFELFSSSPRDFVLYSSDRFPSRDWTILGQFQAKDEKSIQSFNVRPHHFTKYIKVEFHSHYGHEHFCPISLFRVYGTSEFEVLETVDGSEEQINSINENEEDDVGNDDDVNEPIMSTEQDGKKRKLGTSTNLFAGARDAVINMVKKAAEVLVINPHWNQSTTNITSSLVPKTTKYAQSLLNMEHCVTPRYNILCHRCDENFFNSVYRTVSCRIKDLFAMLESAVIWKPLAHYNVCRMFGITSSYLLDDSRTEESYEFCVNNLYVVHLLPRDVIAALCNMIAISENRAKYSGNPIISNVNTATTTKKYDNASVFDHVPYQSVFPITSNKIASGPEPSTSHKLADRSTILTRSQYQYIQSETENLISQIKPTRTTVDPEISVVADHSVNTDAPNLKEAQKENNLSNYTKIVIPEGGNNLTSTVEHKIIENVEDNTLIDSLISEWEKSEYSQPNSVQMSTPKPTSQKESVFVRLANRIKALERNMSLSGQYLEELSRRYKKQIEDMQRILSEMADDLHKSVERETKLHQEMAILNGQVADLSAVVNSLVIDRESWSSKALMVGEHSLILFLEIFIFVFIVCLCRGGIPSVEISKRKFSLEWCRGIAIDEFPANSIAISKKVQSADDLNVNNCSSRTHKRRPSEEALKSDGSTHHDLLIFETHCISKAGRRRKKRKELILKSNANAINLETGDALLKMKTSSERCNQPLSRSASVSEIVGETAWRNTSTESEMFRLSDSKKLSARNSNISSHSFRDTNPTRMKLVPIKTNDENDFSSFLNKSSDQDSAVSTPAKERKMNGIRKIVKKLF